MFDFLASILFPDRCMLCDEVMQHNNEGFYVCNNCIEALDALKPKHTCKICGRLVAEHEDFCNICLTHPHHFDRALSCFVYAKEISEIIIKYKFNQHWDYHRSLSVYLEHLLRPLHRENPFDCIVFPPMTKKSLAKRGLNQSELLAKTIAKHLEIPCLHKALKKVKETPQQSTLGYAERMTNLKGAFALTLPRETFMGKRILLIDDVFTTGATADALSKLLKSAKAKEVIVATVAATSQVDMTVDEEIDPSDVIF